MPPKCPMLSAIGYRVVHEGQALIDSQTMGVCSAGRQNCVKPAADGQRQRVDAGGTGTNVSRRVWHFSCDSDALGVARMSLRLDESRSSSEAFEVLIFWHLKLGYLCPEAQCEGTHGPLHERCLD